eukprot:340217_1
MYGARYLYRGSMGKHGILLNHQRRRISLDHDHWISVIWIQKDILQFIHPHHDFPQLIYVAWDLDWTPDAVLKDYTHFISMLKQLASTKGCIPRSNFNVLTWKPIVIGVLLRPKKIEKFRKMRIFETME